MNRVIVVPRHLATLDARRTSSLCNLDVAQRKYWNFAGWLSAHKNRRRVRRGCPKAAAQEALYIEARAGDELRPVVRADVARRTMHAHEPREHFDDARRANATGHVDRQALARELVDDLC
jgi:hypothetical protein